MKEKLHKTRTVATSAKAKGWRGEEGEGEEKENCQVAVVQ